MIVFGSQQALNFANYGGGTQEKVIKPLVEEVVGSAIGWGYRFTVIYSVISVAGVVYLVSTRGQRRKDVEAPEEKAPKEVVDEQIKPSSGSDDKLVSNKTDQQNTNGLKSEKREK